MSTRKYFWTHSESCRFASVHECDNLFSLKVYADCLITSWAMELDLWTFRWAHTMAKYTQTRIHAFAIIQNRGSCGSRIFDIFRYISVMFRKARSFILVRRKSLQSRPWWKYGHVICYHDKKWINNVCNILFKFQPSFSWKIMKTQNCWYILFKILSFDILISQIQRSCTISISIEKDSPLTPAFWHLCQNGISPQEPPFPMWK